MRNLGLLLLLVVTGNTFADIAPPPPAEFVGDRTVVPVTIKSEKLKGDDASSVAKIIIPKKLLPAKPYSGPARPERDLEGAVPEANKDASLPTRTIIAGIVLACAIVSIPFATKAGRSGRVLLMIVSAAAVLGTIGYLYADLAPGPRNRREPPRPVPVEKSVVIEFSDKGDAVTIILSK